MNCLIADTEGPFGIMVTILGIEFTEWSLERVVEECRRFIRSGSPHVVITAGPEFVMRVLRDPSLRRPIERADLITPDGIGIVLAARWRGTRLAGRVTGIELTERLLIEAETAGWGVYLLGASDLSFQSALSAIRRRHPDLRVDGRHGYFSEEEEREVIDQVAAFAPHILLVGLGQPRQEVFVDRVRDQLNIPLAMGIGGTIDVLGGTVTRAPAWAQRLRLEWLYRLVREPRRLRRQMALPVFAWRAWREGRHSARP